MICPLIGKCNEQVDFDKYQNTCANLTKNAFLECPKYKQFSSTLRTPREWQKVMSTT